mmetsp:Transcript_49529/g.73660  ORF Transcript_49529/g.73660 Transcript_49529/m.73660 type:complete len:255 (-) Transcript_49529:684-1448(-)|eukprot:CAMPEP_0195515946 /NCGR_PEP_ID=MMETSP0794_2-20130614/6831_1 /TAXON_ID=515487 /ORGANISM="Stephanopyxis turris, Strain CCMP 815" /LENGTH=254 /DNA_ID=CAMNT_0040644447 /DNA_START=57 /DNA_END=821 /DNA_ORIENTATION=-
MSSPIDDHNKWANYNEDGGGSYSHSSGGYAENGAREEPRQRTRLKLKPRSSQGVAQASFSSSRKAASNPFGAAKPREEVLADKGIDAKLIDERIQKKSEVVRLTRDQEEEVEAVRAELNYAEKEMREANEKELPEEKYRVMAETKRNELNDLIAKFTSLNASVKEEKMQEAVEQSRYRSKQTSPRAAGGRGGAGTGGRPFERPSERRRRLEQERGEDGGRRYGQEQSGEDAFSSFGGRYSTGRKGGDRRRDSYQ